MKRTITYQPIGPQYLTDALKVVLSAYQEEQAVLGCLPNEQGVVNQLTKSVEKLLHKGSGFAAMLDNQFIGFLAGFEIEELWGDCKGIYSPLYGHGVKKEHRVSVYQELYRRSASMWVEDSCTTHAVKLFAHDKEAIDTWFWLGFGLRCVDSIRLATSINVRPSDVVIRKAGEDDIPSMVCLSSLITKHLRQSPMFMPRTTENPLQEQLSWLTVENHHMWVAYNNGQAVGYIKIQPSAETFVSEHESVMNVTGAYVLKSERGKGVAQMLLNVTQEWLLQNGYSHCGVDFEAFNPEGSSFWNKYFKPYTYTVVRRIDERILSSKYSG